MSGSNPQNDPEALMKFGIQALGQRNFPVALDAFRKAEALNHPPAKAQLGHLYGEGKGVPADQAIARRYYTEGVKLGDLECCTSLGTMMWAGDGGPVDERQGTELMQKAAAAGQAIAQFNLAYAYMFAVGVNKNEELAMRLLYKAAAQGMGQARQQLDQHCRDVGGKNPSLPADIDSEVNDWVPDYNEKQRTINRYRNGDWGQISEEELIGNLRAIKGSPPRRVIGRYADVGPVRATHYELVVETDFSKPVDRVRARLYVVYNH